MDQASLRLQTRLANDPSWPDASHGDADFDPDEAESYAAVDGWLVQARPHFELARTDHDITPRELGPTLAHLGEDDVLDVLGDLLEERFIRFSRTP